MGVPPAASTLQQPLPPPPPSVKKKATIWDDDHISETLLGIGQAFLSNQNFGEGLGAAAGVMSKGQQALRDDAKRTITYGGPDNQFEISADKNGNRTVRRVPEFAQAAQEAREAKAAPAWKDTQDVKSRVLYQIGQLPQDKRAGAYAGVMANPQAYGIDPRGMPPAWDDTYGTVAGNAGLTVNQSLNAVRADRLADNRISTNDARTAQGEARLNISRAADARSERKSRLPKVPASVTRKATVKTPAGYILD
jgi:hypothetical protein